MNTIDYVTIHARQRGAQRRITSTQMETVIKYGRRIYAANAAHYFFGRTEALRHRETLRDEVDRLTGIVVVVDSSTVITVYRNSRALSYIKRRPRWRFNTA